MASPRQANQQATIRTAVHTHANDRVDDVEFGVLAGLAADALPETTQPEDAAPPEAAAPTASATHLAADDPASDPPAPAPPAQPPSVARTQPEEPATPAPAGPPVGEGTPPRTPPAAETPPDASAAPPAVADLLPDLDYSLVGQHVRPLTLNVTDGFELELFSIVRRLARWRGKRVTREQVFTAAVAAAPRDPDAIRDLLEAHPTAPDPGADPLRVAVRLAPGDHDTLADLQLELRYDKTRVSLSRLLAAFTAAHLDRLDRALTAAGH